MCAHGLTKTAVSVKWLANTINRGLQSRMSGLSSKDMPSMQQLNKLTDRITSWGSKATKRNVNEIRSIAKANPLNASNIGKNPEQLFTQKVRELSGNQFIPDIVPAKSREAYKRLYRQVYRKNFARTRPRGDLLTRRQSRKPLKPVLKQEAKRLQRLLTQQPGSYSPQVAAINTFNSLPIALHEAGHAIDLGRRPKRLLTGVLNYGAEVLANREASKLLRNLISTSHPHLAQQFPVEQYLNYANKLQLENYRLNVLKTIADKVRTFNQPGGNYLLGVMPPDRIASRRKEFDLLTAQQAPKPLRNMYDSLLNAYEIAATNEFNKATSRPLIRNLSRAS